MLAISIHSTTFQGLSALKEGLNFQTRGIQGLERVVTFFFFFSFSGFTTIVVTNEGLEVARG